MRVTRLRKLLLTAAPQPKRPRHLSAASGLVRVGGLFYVVADDELQLGVFPFRGNARGNLIRLVDGELPDSKRARKKVKPDFEALALIPPFGKFSHGALMALGSGSRRTRQYGVLLPLNARGLDVTSLCVFDASELYAAAAREVGEVNIEGAVIVGDRLVLVQRGNKGNAVNATIAFDLKRVLRSVADKEAIAKAKLLAVMLYDMGGIAGVPLCFTDAASLPDGSIAFSAVAEDTTDAYQDGPCVGSAVGLIDHRGRLQALHYLDGILKPEGIHAEKSAAGIRLWLVTDDDDASMAAALYTAQMTLDR